MIICKSTPDGLMEKCIESADTNIITQTDIIIILVGIICIICMIYMYKNMRK